MFYNELYSKLDKGSFNVFIKVKHDLVQYKVAGNQFRFD